jgi:hypothetical protein
MMSRNKLPFGQWAHWDIFAKRPLIISPELLKEQLKEEKIQERLREKERERVTYRITSAHSPHLPTTNDVATCIFRFFIDSIWLRPDIFSKSMGPFVTHPERFNLVSEH